MLCSLFYWCFRVEDDRQLFSMQLSAVSNDVPHNTLSMFSTSSTLIHLAHLSPVRTVRYAQNLNEMQQRFTDFQAAAEARAAGTGTVGSALPLNR